MNHFPAHPPRPRHRRRRRAPPLSSFVPARTTEPHGDLAEKTDWQPQGGRRRIRECGWPIAPPATLPRIGVQFAGGRPIDSPPGGRVIYSGQHHTRPRHAANRRLLARRIPRDASMTGSRRGRGAPLPRHALRQLTASSRKRTFARSTTTCMTEVEPVEKRGGRARAALSLQPALGAAGVEMGSACPTRTARRRRSTRRRRRRRRRRRTNSLPGAPILSRGQAIAAPCRIAAHGAVRLRTASPPMTRRFYYGRRDRRLDAPDLRGPDSPPQVWSAGATGPRAGDGAQHPRQRGGRDGPGGRGFAAIPHRRGHAGACRLPAAQSVADGPATDESRRRRRPRDRRRPRAGGVGRDRDRRDAALGRPRHAAGRAALHRQLLRLSPQPSSTALRRRGLPRTGRQPPCHARAANRPDPHDPRGRRTAPRRRSGRCGFGCRGFGWRLSDAEVAELASFVRSAWSNSARRRHAGHGRGPARGGHGRPGGIRGSDPARRAPAGRGDHRRRAGLPSAPLVDPWRLLVGRGHGAPAGGASAGSVGAHVATPCRRLEPSFRPRRSIDPDTQQ